MSKPLKLVPIQHAMQTQDVQMERLQRGMKERIRAEQGKVNELLARLEGRNARAILERGFTLCSDHQSGRVLRSSDDAVLSRDVRITFHDGDLLTEVKEKIHEQG